MTLVPASEGVLVDVSLVHQVLSLLVRVVGKDPEMLLEVGLDLVGPVVEAPLELGIGPLDRREGVERLPAEVCEPAEAGVAQAHQLHGAAVLPNNSSILHLIKANKAIG